MESRIGDDVQENRIYAVSTLYKGDEYLAYQNPTLIPNIEQAFDEGASFFKKRLDKVMHAASPASQNR